MPLRFDTMASNNGAKEAESGAAWPLGDEFLQGALQEARIYSRMSWVGTAGIGLRGTKGAGARQSSGLSRLRFSESGSSVQPRAGLTWRELLGSLRTRERSWARAR